MTLESADRSPDTTTLEAVPDTEFDLDPVYVPDHDASRRSNATKIDSWTVSSPG